MIVASERGLATDLGAKDRTLRLVEVVEADDPINLRGYRCRDSRSRQGRERDTTAWQPIAHETDVKGVVDYRGRRSYRDREAVGCHFPWLQSVGAKDRVDRGDL
jgi:hypothetical protein